MDQVDNSKPFSVWYIQVHGVEQAGEKNGFSYFPNFSTAILQFYNRQLEYLFRKSAPICTGSLLYPFSFFSALAKSFFLSGASSKHCRWRSLWKNFSLGIV